MITMEKKEMTTIAYDHKNKTIAWDSRKTSSDNIIMNDDEGKHVERDGVHFWLAGTACDLESMIDAYFTQQGCMRNRRAWVNNKTGVVGVTIHPSGLYVAHIRISGKRKNIGYSMDQFSGDKHENVCKQLIRVS